MKFRYFVNSSYGLISISGKNWFHGIFAFLAVDPQVGTTEGKTFDIIFVGTTRGRVIKAINAQAADASSGVETIVIEELQIFDPNVIIRELKGKLFSKVKLSLVIATTFKFSRQKHDAKIQENCMFWSVSNSKWWNFDYFKLAKPQLCHAIFG